MEKSGEEKMRKEVGEKKSRKSEQRFGEQKIRRKELAKLGERKLADQCDRRCDSQ